MALDTSLETTHGKNVYFHYKKIKRFYGSLKTLRRKIYAYKILWKKIGVVFKLTILKYNVSEIILSPSCVCA